MTPGVSSDIHMPNTPCHPLRHNGQSPSLSPKPIFLPSLSFNVFLFLGGGVTYYFPIFDVSHMREHIVTRAALIRYQQNVLATSIKTGGGGGKLGMLWVWHQASAPR